MKKIFGILTLISLVGCASAPSQISASANPLSPLNVNCSYAYKTIPELQTIIDRPNSDLAKNWTVVFSRIYGNETAQQRQSSAKTVLWTIRTRCPGS
jgi:hypothetical protein